MDDDGGGEDDDAADGGGNPDYVEHCERILLNP